MQKLNKLQYLYTLLKKFNKIIKLLNQTQLFLISICLFMLAYKPYSSKHILFTHNDTDRKYKEIKLPLLLFYSLLSIKQGIFKKNNKSQ